jgi:hypothetical protein
VKAIGLHDVRAAQLLLGLCFIGLLPGAGAAAAESLDPHAFHVRGGEVVLDAGVYFLDADIDFRLSAAARDALESGVPLTFELQVELVRPRDLWFDEKVATLVQDYRLRYHALSRRYVLINLNTGESRSFSTREGAMRKLGRVRSFPVIDRSLLKAGQEYQLWLRAGLDVDELPPPLKTGAYLSPQWRLLSEWHVWRFEA